MGWWIHGLHACAHLRSPHCHASPPILKHILREPTPLPHMDCMHAIPCALACSPPYIGNHSSKTLTLTPFRAKVMLWRTLRRDCSRQAVAAGSTVYRWRRGVEV
eukprot:262686-Chlamydomonas_euryale.AAC.6